MVLQGRVWKFGNDIDTDIIIPTHYCTSIDPEYWAQHCMEGLDPQFSRKIKAGDIIVAGKNFGCGSSREPAPVAIKWAGISCIIAESFARIFYRNAFNVGLPLLEYPDAQSSIDEGEDLQVDLDLGKINNLSKNTVLQAKPIPPFMQELINNGGLLKNIARQLDLKNCAG